MTSFVNVKLTNMFGKVLSASSLLIFFGSAGGQCTLTGAWPVPKSFHMTRRALLGSRLIRLPAKSCSKRVVKKLCILIRKVITIQNLCIRLASEQFSLIGQVITYPEMYSPCLSMRFRKICTDAKVFFMTPTFEKNEKCLKIGPPCRELSYQRRFT